VSTQHLLAAPLPPLAKADVEAVAVFPYQPQARHLVQHLGEEGLHVLEHVEAEVKRVPGQLAGAAEQLRMMLADVGARVGPGEPVGEGGIEGREGQARGPAQLEPD
jgi:hypothetical protein